MTPAISYLFFALVTEIVIECGALQKTTNMSSHTSAEFELGFESRAQPVHHQWFQRH